MFDVAVRKASHPLPGHQQKLLANALAPAENMNGSVAIMTRP